ncbi:MAG: alcohol dehydrogenase catalytic domain-containing protein, partial [Acidobacteriota bacterium]|nr:alcohol dehydrogenase catalytic domain-containing protein [Acidobacteriota bacterium]
MQALTFHGKKTIRLEQVPDPGLREPTDVIVKVRLTAICGSDMHVYHERETGLDDGTIMGHEFVGKVVETGSDVASLTTGTRVVSPFTTSCGRCHYCAIGLTARCVSGQLYGWVEKGQGLHGAQAEYVRVPMADSTLMPIPEGVTDDEALLAGDVLSTGFFCAQMAGVTPQGVYAIVGCGPVGLMAAIGAREQGAGKLFAIDRVPERLAMAESFGASPVNAATDDPVDAILEATEGRGADAVLEAVGSPSAGRLAYDLVRPGGTISVVGVHNEEGFAFSPADAYDKNLTYRVGRCPARNLMPQVLALLEAKR